MASLVFLIVTLIPLVMGGVAPKEAQGKNLIDDIRDMPNKISENIGTFVEDRLQEFRKNIIDDILEIPNKISENIGTFVQDRIQEFRDRFVNIDGKRMLCFPGICRMVEIKMRCSRVDECPEGYTLIDKLCGCCNECVTTEFAMLSSKNKRNFEKE